MDNPGLSNANGGNSALQPTKLSNIKFQALKIYMADNEAGTWRPVIRGENDMNIINNLNVLDVWSTTHLPASTIEQAGERGRRVAADRHGSQGCNNLFFDGHADFLRKDENTAKYWVNTQINN